jgi:hypothetical protein
MPGLGNTVVLQFFRIKTLVDIISGSEFLPVSKCLLYVDNNFG